MVEFYLHTYTKTGNPFFTPTLQNYQTKFRNLGLAHVSNTTYQ